MYIHILCIAALCCSVLQLAHRSHCVSLFIAVAVCYNVVKCVVAVCCSVLQCAAARSSAPSKLSPPTPAPPLFAAVPAATHALCDYVMYVCQKKKIGRVYVCMCVCV